MARQEPCQKVASCRRSCQARRGREEEEANSGPSLFQFLIHFDPCFFSCNRTERFMFMVAEKLY